LAYIAKHKMGSTALETMVRIVM